MKWSLFALGALMIVIGGSCILSGYPIVEVERGWTLTISGAVAMTGGAIVLALGAFLTSLEALFRAAANSVRGEAALAEPALPRAEFRVPPAPLQDQPPAFEPASFAAAAAASAAMDRDHETSDLRRAGDAQVARPAPYPEPVRAPSPEPMTSFSPFSSPATRSPLAPPPPAPIPQRSRPVGSVLVQPTGAGDPAAAASQPAQSYRTAAEASASHPGAALSPRERLSARASRLDSLRSPSFLRRESPEVSAILAETEAALAASLNLDPAREMPHGERSQEEEQAGTLEQGGEREPGETRETHGIAGLAEAAAAESVLGDADSETRSHEAPDPEPIPASEAPEPAVPIPPDAAPLEPEVTAEPPHRRFPIRSLTLPRGPWPASPAEPKAASALESGSEAASEAASAEAAAPAGAEDSPSLREAEAPGPVAISDDWLERALAGLEEPAEAATTAALLSSPEAELPPPPDANPDQHRDHEPDAAPAGAEEMAATQAGPAEPAVIGRYETEGTVYVMYADGSIDAETATGVFRFESLAALKAHIENLA